MWTERKKVSVKGNLDSTPLVKDLVDSIFGTSFHQGEKVVPDGVEIEAPGVKKEDVKVTIDGSQLTVSFRDRHGTERSYSYVITDVCRSDVPRATLADGVLRVLFAPREGVRPEPTRVTVE